MQQSIFERVTQWFGLLICKVFNKSSWEYGGCIHRDCYFGRILSTPIKKTTE